MYSWVTPYLYIVCDRGLDSNPQATITWTAPDGTTVMNNARFNFENGPEMVRLNITHTDNNDNGWWTCEINVTSERHVVGDGGKLILENETIIGSPIRREFVMISISEFS